MCRSFVFHETRCGSTLVADMLGSHPHHLTFSESSPPASLAGEGHVENLRTVRGGGGVVYSIGMWLLVFWLTETFGQLSLDTHVYPCSRCRSFGGFHSV